MRIESKCEGKYWNRNCMKYFRLKTTRLNCSPTLLYRFDPLFWYNIHPYICIPSMNQISDWGNSHQFNIHTQGFMPSFSLILLHAFDLFDLKDSAYWTPSSLLRKVVLISWSKMKKKVFMYVYRWDKKNSR